MNRNGRSYFLTFVIIAIIASTIWARFQKNAVDTYLENTGSDVISESDLELIKEDARSEGYDEGYEAGYSKGETDGYEQALEDYQIDVGVTYATVYYTDAGECYHMNPSCVSIRYNDNIHETTLDKLKGSGLRPCDICVPHSDD